MSRADAWMPLYIGDYARKTLHLTRDQHGAYLLLIMSCWINGGSLPSDPGQLAAITKATPGEWRKLAPIILPFFDVDGDKITHGRIIEEHQKAQRLSEARRESGRKGGRPRKQTESKPKPIGSANGKQNTKQTETPSPGSNSAPSEQRVTTYRGASAVACLEGATPPPPIDPETRKEVGAMMAEFAGSLRKGLAVQ